VAAPFTYLTIAEFERLGSRDKLAYLGAAMAELQRTRGAQVHGWDNLFAQPATQQQQQEQPQSDPPPPESPGC